MRDKMAGDIQYKMRVMHRNSIFDFIYAVLVSELTVVTEKCNFETIIENSIKPSAQCVVSWAREQIDCLSLNCIILYA